MNKKFLFTAMVSVTVLCSACTGQTAFEEENEIQSDVSTANETEPEEMPDTPTVSESSDNGSHAYAQITFETKEDNDVAEDGPILYTSRCVYPVVTMEENEVAAEKTNAEIQTKVDAFFADTSIRELAKEDYRMYQADEAINSGTFHADTLAYLKKNCCFKYLSEYHVGG